jgi:alkanesulfonate monooxygenase
MSARRLRFGLNLNNRAPLIYPGVVQPLDLVGLAREAERLGLDSIWVGDNLFSRYRFEAITTLAAVAVTTERVRLGTATLIAPLRQTIWLAIAWATLDQLAGGRTILTMSVGGGMNEEGSRVTKAEYELVGKPYERRGQILEEQLEVLRRLWSGDPVTYGGEFHRFDGFRLELLPAQRPAPPLWVANNPHFYGLPERVVARMLGRVARLADGWMTNAMRPEELRAMRDRIRNVAQAEGRDPDTIATAYQMTLAIGDDRADAERHALEYIGRYYNARLESLRDSPWGRTDPFGPPESCAAAIRALGDAGVGTFILRFAAADQAGQLERFVRDVRPRLAEDAGEE